jgi:hypothetical protein
MVAVFGGAWSGVQQHCLLLLTAIAMGWGMDFVWQWVLTPMEYSLIVRYVLGGEVCDGDRLLRLRYRNSDPGGWSAVHERRITYVIAMGFLDRRYENLKLAGHTLFDRNDGRLGQFLRRRTCTWWCREETRWNISHGWRDVLCGSSALSVAIGGHSNE